MNYTVNQKVHKKGILELKQCFPGKESGWKTSPVRFSREPETKETLIRRLILD